MYLVLRKQVAVGYDFLDSSVVCELDFRGLRDESQPRLNVFMHYAYLTHYGIFCV